MKINELKPAVTAPEPAWKSQLREFWSHAGDYDQINMQVLLKMGDLSGAETLLESWHQQQMSERKKKKKKSAAKQKFQYGNFGGWFYPGYHNHADSTEGGGDGGGESMFEQTDAADSIIDRFAQSCAQLLELQSAPEIVLHKDPDWTQQNGTFGRYTAAPQRQIELAVSGRHIIDVLRTLAHEMTHAAQDEQAGLPDDAGETGSPWEDEANAMAGRIMRHWADQEPEMFAGVELEENWRQKLGGAAVAAACVAGAPGCATMDPAAIRTVQDIGRTAHTLKNISRAGAQEELTQRLKDELRRQQTGRVNESSGYIPVDQSEAQDPRYSMAVTNDIKPGEPQRQAAKMGWKISRAGVPPVLKTNGNR